MKKLSLIIFLFLTTLLGNSQTYISVGIYSDSTWSPTGNPYIVNGDTVIFQGVTLTIQPGVIVKFDSNVGLDLRGKIKAVGTENNKITFTSNSNNPQMSDWNGITVTGSISSGEENQILMEHCTGEYATNFVHLSGAKQGPYIFRNCSFLNNIRTNYRGGYPIMIFEDCHFESNILALDSSPYQSRVSNSTFINNNYGLEGIEIVEGCYFSGHTGIALSPYGSTTGCFIENNNIAVSCYFNSVNNTFRDNVIINNTVGVEILTFFNGSIDFTGNSICNNSDYNIKLHQQTNADLSDNCWCTNNNDEIRSSILDGYVNTNYGLVNFLPLASDCPQILLNVDDYSDQNQNIKIYPNPVKSLLNVVVNSDNNYKIEVFALDGKLIFQQNFIRQINIDMQELSDGFYFFKIKGFEGVIKSGKLIKAR